MVELKKRDFLADSPSLYPSLPRLGDTRPFSADGITPCRSFAVVFTVSFFWQPPGRQESNVITVSVRGIV